MDGMTDVATLRHNVFEGPCTACELMSEVTSIAQREHMIFRLGFEDGYDAAMGDADRDEYEENQRDVHNVVSDL